MNERQKKIIFSKAFEQEKKLEELVAKGDCPGDKAKMLLGITVFAEDLLRDLMLYSEYQEYVEQQRIIEKLGDDWVEITNICRETDKAYGFISGTNGCVGRGNCEVHYGWVAKSKCRVIGERVFAPFWAL